MYLCTSNTPQRYIYAFPENEASNKLLAKPTSDTKKGAPSPITMEQGLLSPRAGRVA